MRGAELAQHVTATSLNNLAGLYETVGDYAKAEPLLQEALRIQQKVLGPERPATASSLDSLASLYDKMGNYAKAEPLLREALHLVRRYGTLVRGLPPEDELSANLETLYEALWAPIDQALPSQTKRIIISPDGELNFISFATLLTKDQQFLAQTYDFQYVATGRDLLRELRPSTARDVVLFANPEFDLTSTTILTTADNGSSNADSIRGSEKREIEDWSFASLEGTQKESDELIKKFAGWGWTPRDFIPKRPQKKRCLRSIHPTFCISATHGFFAKEDPTSAKTRPRSAVQRSAERHQIEVFQEPDAPERVSLGRSANHD